MFNCFKFAFYLAVKINLIGYLETTVEKIELASPCTDPIFCKPVCKFVRCIFCIHTHIIIVTNNNFLDYNIAYLNCGTFDKIIKCIILAICGNK